jgi:hypothetical protein
MELHNPRPIRSLYDLGRALDETQKFSTQFSQSFKDTLHGEVPLSDQDLADQQVGR